MRVVLKFLPVGSKRSGLNQVSENIKRNLEHGN